jgi:hypothetical protein|tara:strand:- start:4195 stop:5493 length:1299 start_codon:yes stop_codon:yes gene_type:complete
MATPILTPSSQTSTAVLPSTGSLGTGTDGAGNTVHYPFGMYADSDAPLYDANFITGASDQVAYTFKKLGGDILDIELKVGNIYASYEEASLEYSYIVNIHQSKNILHSSLGAATGTFDSDGQRTDSLSGSSVETKYPKFKFGYAKRVMDHTSTEVGIGGTQPIYSASIDLTHNIQDYDLQTIIYSSSIDGSAAGALYSGSVGSNRINIRRVFYKTPHAMWRFYGYYGGMNSVGNLSTYGMYADDSTFEVIPAWQNKLQAMAYEDAIYTRNSHYSYEIKNNKMRIHPIPTSASPDSMFVEFNVDYEPWDDQSDRKSGGDGVNNMNTLPLANIPYKNINSIGKQWIRRFSLSLAKETLGQVRSKFGTIPIPGNDVTLNGDKLISEAREEQKTLREELQKVLDEITYEKITELQKNITKNSLETLQNYPYFIYQG